MIRRLSVALFLLMTVLVAFASPSGIRADGPANWPEFRGPGGDGHAGDAKLPDAIDESVVQWKVPIHGRAWSSPVVWGQTVWMTTASEDGKDKSVVAVDLDTGKIVHDVVVLHQEEPAFCYPANSHASPTPVVEEGRLYVHFGSTLTACLDTKTCEVIWRRDDFECDHHRGAASSPILFDGKLFVAFDGFDVQYVVAIDAKTGQTLWKTDRNIDYGTDNGDRMKAYGTASVFRIAGRDQLVCPSASATIAYDVATGRPIWTVYHDGMNASARPLLGDDQIFITNGSGSMVAVKTGGTGDVTGSHIDWMERKSVPKKSSPLLVDGLLYTNSDDGVLSCREASTGRVLWSKRAGKEYAASPIYAGGKIYFFSVQGDIITVRPGPTLDMVAQTKLGDGFMASPAVVGDRMILRSKTELFCVGN